ncbi:hypothetical protein WAI453_010782 [Rhynchosporium graminicola]|uniref:Glycosyltransferase 2 n=1 Tax=Rhynchosporium graminicola TaxID=2792576 RepID=A0A1E1L919_9HELO|nr:uncharacterized protein RCO7_09645 [Rhynchosporium commune]
MPMHPRRLPADIELGKRDDDHRLRSKGGLGSGLGNAWQHRHMPFAPRRKNLRKIALGIVAVIGLYYFFKNMPTDLENPRKRPSYEPPFTPDPPLPNLPEDHDIAPSPGQEVVAETVQHNYNGPIKFYELSSTLHDASRTGGIQSINNNVLFAAASLKSAAILLPIACDMAIRERNFVHFALMGRDEIPMGILQSVNGISEECKIMFHDARPDFPTTSSDFRMEVSSGAAFGHINTFIHPQATLIDGSEAEEPWFSKGLRNRAMTLGRTVIELPDKVESNLMWLNLLDSASLSAWHKVTVDIIIRAQPSASGSLIRLLESLKKADFSSSAVPRLTIELPHDIDEPSRRYLEKFRWPAIVDRSTGSLLTLHHRIPQHGVTAEENSIRFLESFWPRDPLNSHVLVLSPMVELSPLFFHYLKYHTLEYMYSANRTDLRQSLLGISLDLPSTYLNDSSSFTPPVAGLTGGGNKPSKGVRPFLWQAPNSNAALYFGDKWVEMHDFVGQLLASRHKLPTPTTLNEKLVSKTYPSWLEHVLKLVRARGYWTIYPTLENEHSLAALHHDLFKPPEEYSEEMNAEKAETGVLTADPKEHLSLKNKEKPIINLSLLGILPAKGDLPKLSEMPILTWDGGVADLKTSEQLALNYSRIFRREIGGCGKDAQEKERLGMFAGDLFCLDDLKT